MVCFVSIFLVALDWSWSFRLGREFRLLSSRTGSSLNYLSMGRASPHAASTIMHIVQFERYRTSLASYQLEVI